MRLTAAASISASGAESGRLNAVVWRFRPHQTEAQALAFLSLDQLYEVTTARRHINWDNQEPDLKVGSGSSASIY